MTVNPHLRTCKACANTSWNWTILPIGATSGYKLLSCPNCGTVVAEKTEAIA